jgi:hypothetical protein
LLPQLYEIKEESYYYLSLFLDILLLKYDTKGEYIKRDKTKNDKRQLKARFFNLQSLTNFKYEDVQQNQHKDYVPNEQQHFSKSLNH